MRDFAELRGEQTPVGHVEIGYIAMSGPSVDEVLARAAAGSFRRVVVQPHLLFDGQLLIELRQKIAQIADRNREQQWIVAEHLGPHPLLAQAVVQRWQSGLAVEFAGANQTAEVPSHC